MAGDSADGKTAEKDDHGPLPPPASAAAASGRLCKSTVVIVEASKDADGPVVAPSVAASFHTSESARLAFARCLLWASRFCSLRLAWRSVSTTTEADEDEEEEEAACIDCTLA